MANSHRSSLMTGIITPNHPPSWRSMTASSILNGSFLAHFSMFFGDLSWFWCFRAIQLKTKAPVLSINPKHPTIRPSDQRLHVTSLYMFEIGNNLDVRPSLECDIFLSPKTFCPSTVIGQFFSNYHGGLWLYTLWSTSIIHGQSPFVIGKWTFKSTIHGHF